ncbi:hypothetical protein [Tenacibaculum maritimum]|uniref:hypothetical protein n=1 Tax=Tenacibaculum maritimum TaxID=107401 RepID=UPI0012E539F1|nr:hypothetical protein [Tenacibaculum maritimum]CAA0214670.1 hypothetical protein TMP445_540002 [Tenacibaculum maritimum]
MKNILKLLCKIYTNEDDKRTLWVNSFQELIEETEFLNESVEEIMVELSSNLEFYVDNINLRNEDPSYFGEKKLQLLLFEFLIDYNMLFMKQDKL